MPTETDFARWFDRWLTVNKKRGDFVANELGVSEATISAWRNGSNPPRAEYLVPLAKMTGETLEHLGHLAYGWPEKTVSDPAMKKPLIREGLILLKQLEEMGGGLLETVLAMIRAAVKDRERDKG